ncbi:MAG: lysylphosphatidylglycerol synthase domain-containing protein, partial [Bacillota bacterium]|nr:lysylphosphatidylglycerol synthase domain-containing protein [Bacillota bacterium]
MVWVVLSWILLLLSTWLGIMGMNFFGLFSVRMALTVFAATNIINFIPASPGAIGFFEYSTVLGLSGLGVDSTRALAVSLPLHLIQYISLLPLGAVLYALALHGKYGDAVRSVIHKNKK